MTDAATPPSDDALARLLSEQHEWLVAYVRRNGGRLLLRLETAEDLVQELCARLLGKPEPLQLGNEASVRAWLTTTARRFLAGRRDHWRALKRSGGELLRLSFATAAGDASAAGLGPVRELAASVTGPSTFATRREQLSIAALALDLLLPRDRQLVEGMCGGLDLREQAATLGLSYDAAERARLRAIERFRCCFEIVARGHGQRTG